MPTDCLLTAETSEKKKEHWWQHHYLWPYFLQASSADRTPDRDLWLLFRFVALCLFQI